MFRFIGLILFATVLGGFSYLGEAALNLDYDCLESEFCETKDKRAPMDRDCDSDCSHIQIHLEILLNPSKSVLLHNHLSPYFYPIPVNSPPVNYLSSIRRPPKV